MRLSVIVPVYNMAADDKLKHCLDSLLAQTVEDMEIIAVDDASTDDSAAILRDYEEKHPGKIKAIYSVNNHHQGGAKNRGLGLASGKWVGFVDSDDFVAADMYEKLLAKAEETGADLVGCDYSIVDRYGFECGKVVENNSADQTGILDAKKHKSHILKNGSMVVKIYLRSVIEGNSLSFPEDIFYEDNCAAPLWSVYFRHFERVEEPLYYYLQLGDSTTHHVDWNKCRDRITAGEIFIAECKRRDLIKDYGDEIYMRFTELTYINTLFSYMYSGKWRSIRNCGVLRDLIKRVCPDFRRNPYYKERVSEEYKKLIDLHMRSNLLFYLYYIALYGYRNAVKKVRK